MCSPCFLHVVGSLQQKKFCAKKKLFTTRTFLLALCARPYPLPLQEKLPLGLCAIVGYGLRGHVALQHFCPHGLRGFVFCGLLWVIPFS